MCCFDSLVLGNGFFRQLGSLIHSLLNMGLIKARPVVLSFPNCELSSYFKDDFHFLFLCSRLFFIADFDEEQPILFFFFMI